MKQREVVSGNARLDESKRSLRLQRENRNSQSDDGIHHHREMCAMRGRILRDFVTEGPYRTIMSDVERSVEKEESSRIGVGTGKTGSMTVEIVEDDMIDMVRVVVGAAEAAGAVVEVDLVAEPSMTTMIIAAARLSSKDEA